MQSSGSWHLYILECADGTYYTGITNNLEKRFTAHNSGKGGRYTRARVPVRIIYQEKVLDRSTALTREHAVKALSREQKKKLIDTIKML